MVHNLHWEDASEIRFDNLDDEARAALEDLRRELKHLM